MKLIMENWNKFLNESPASDQFVKNADAGLVDYVAMLKQIAKDPEFRALARSGLTDA